MKRLCLNAKLIYAVEYQINSTFPLKEFELIQTINYFLHLIVCKLGKQTENYGSHLTSWNNCLIHNDTLKPKVFRKIEKGNRDMSSNILGNFWCCMILLWHEVKGEHSIDTYINKWVGVYVFDWCITYHLPQVFNRIV